MPTVDELIHAIASGDMVTANQTFATMMQDKINSSMDDRKIEMAQSMLGIESEEEQTDEDEDEDEDEDNGEEDLEGADDHDEVQGVSD